jgi:16S rRNA (uracil1498-N3)-methyltransferase
MSLHTQLVPSLAGVAAGSVVEVTGAEAHHAVAVRRIAVGEPVSLTDGLGRVALGSVAATGKQLLSVAVSSVTSEPEPAPAFTVVQALPKGERGELAVEVLTEIGVTTIVPWAASRSVAVWRGERAAKSLAKWQTTAREAAKQAHRAWFPTVTPMATTAEVASLVGAAPLALVLHEEASAPLPASVPESVVLVVGPEGGLSPEEVAAFTSAGALAVRLGSEVLRTSTAGLAACAALMARTPRWA